MIRSTVSEESTSRRHAGPGGTPDPTLVNWNGRVHPIVRIDGERWMLKRETARERLGYLLAAGRLNVPEVRPWGPTSGGHVVAAVRLAENYRRQHLPISDPDEAVASELAFSAWIRRRDTHAFNRAYVDGIPMFFDHGAAFDPTERSEVFVRDGADNGYVGRWRVRHRRWRPTTLGERAANSRSGYALHAVRHLDRVDRFIEEWTERIEARDETEIAAAVRRAGWNGGGDEMVEQLVQWRDELPHLMTRIRPLLTAPILVS